MFISLYTSVALLFWLLNQENCDILSYMGQYSWWLNDLVFLGVWLSVPLSFPGQTLVALRTTVNPSDQLSHWHSISVTEWFNLTGDLCPTLSHAFHIYICSHAFYIHNIILTNGQMLFSRRNRFHSYELVKSVPYWCSFSLNLSCPSRLEQSPCCFYFTWHCQLHFRMESVDAWIYWRKSSVRCTSNTIRSGKWLVIGAFKSLFGFESKHFF